MFVKNPAILWLGLCFTLILSACQSTGGSSGGSSSGGGQPDWVRDPYKRYNRQTDLAAVGSANSRDAAEKSALGRLIAIFGQSIEVDDKLKTTFQMATQGGVLDTWSETTGRDTVILIITSMDTLVGAEIGDVWDNDANYYAVAVLNKTKAAATYSNMVRQNQDIINNLVGNISSAEKNSFEGMGRYQFAAMLADINISYGAVLSQVGAGGIAQGLKPGDEYRIEARNIAKTIPVGIIVNNDRAGRIQGAFAKSFSELGFLSGGNNSRYVLRADISTEPVILDQPNKFTRITVDANLTDTRTNTVLVPFNFNSREGHATQAEADNRAYTAAERKINEEYKGMLSDYLSQMLPKR